MYIKIWNKSDGVNRLNLQYLGLSTKRENDEKIGQFGSGIKYAPILALRKDIDFVITSNDDDGEYELRYTTNFDRGIEVVCYDYGTYQVPSSFTIDAGKLSWETEFQIYREAVSNAKDGAESESDWGVELVENIEYIKGQFCVFITATPEMRVIAKNHDYYYCDKAKSYYTHNNDFSILENRYGNTVVYCKTVLAYENDKPSFFHYNSKFAKLNEERKLSSFYSTQYDIARAIAEMDNSEAITKVINNVIGENPVDQKSMEFWEYSDTYFEYVKSSSVWKEKFVEKFGDRSVLLSEMEYIIPGVTMKVKELNYTPIYCRSINLYKILKSASVRTLSNIAGEELTYDLEYDYENYPNLMKAIKVVNCYESGFLSMAKKIALFSPSSPEILGLTLNVKKPIVERQILISKSHASTATVENIIATLIHEYDHYISGLSDNNIEFRSLADARIGKLVMQNYKPKILFVEKGSRNIKINISDLHYIQGLNWRIEKTESLNGNILTLGSKKFIIKSQDIVKNLSGKLVPCEDNISLSITNAFYSPVENDNIEIQEIR